MGISSRSETRVLVRISNLSFCRTHHALCTDGVCERCHPDEVVAGDETDRRALARLGQLNVEMERANLVCL